MKKILSYSILVASLVSLAACGNKKHEHSFENYTITTQPGCLTAGEETGTCSCGETDTRPVDALGHDWDAGTMTTAVTCDSDGVKTFFCNRCQTSKQETITKLGHKKEADWSSDATTHWHACENGCDSKFDLADHTSEVAYDESQHWNECSICGHELSEKVAHVYDQQVIDAKYLAAEAEWYHETTYYKSCVCGASSKDTEGQSFFSDNTTAFVLKEVELTVTPTKTTYGKARLVYTNNQKSPEMFLPELGNKSFWSVVVDDSLDTKVTETFSLVKSVNLVVYIKWLNANDPDNKTHTPAEGAQMNKFFADLASTSANGYQIVREHVPATDEWVVRGLEHYHVCECGDCEYVFDEDLHEFIETIDAKYLKSARTATTYDTYWKHCSVCDEMTDDTYGEPTFVDRTTKLVKPVSHSNYIAPGKGIKGSVTLTYENGQQLHVIIPAPMFVKDATSATYADSNAYSKTAVPATCTEAGQYIYTLVDINTLAKNFSPNFMLITGILMSWAVDQTEEELKGTKYDTVQRAEIFGNIVAYLTENGLSTINISEAALGHYYQYTGNGTNIELTCAHESTHKITSTKTITGYGVVSTAGVVSGRGTVGYVNLIGSVVNAANAAVYNHETGEVTQVVIAGIEIFRKPFNSAENQECGLLLRGIDFENVLIGDIVVIYA